MGLVGVRIFIEGIVQGVGFRPFVFGLAKNFELKGWVRNTSSGVEIEVDGEQDSIRQFIRSLHNDAPPLSRIDEIKIEEQPTNGFLHFEIVQSEAQIDGFQPISPDVGICDDCLRELFDPADRRFLYPFINCTNCGPRFTIIQDIPYDRQKTTMAAFQMCPECESEYHDPLDRRFHAQPTACPVCGPHVWLESRHEKLESSAAFKAAIQLLREGKIVAIKGLGGFHLACDATNPEAVATLRNRKLRVHKPFAIMMNDLAMVRKHCYTSPREEEIITSRERPIVILTRRPGSFIDPNVSPGQDTLGVLLPYTPLHYLLFTEEPRLSEGRETQGAHLPLILVMTSGNLSEEPIATENEEAIRHLDQLADAFLMHNRPIYNRCDDSVVRVVPFDEPPKFTKKKVTKNTRDDRSREEKVVAPVLFPIRRSRGYVPFPVYLGRNLPPILAVGGELKNVFCMTRGKYAFMSHHVGDLENYETFRSFEEGIKHFERLFRMNPQILAYDLHPDYLSTQYALDRSASEQLPAFGIQHHHAHIAACMAENHVAPDEDVLGVALDGTGYGDDGAIWGGEFLLANCRGFDRLAHIKYIPLLGGELAIREPWRVALAWLAEAGIEWTEDLPPVSHLLEARSNQCEGYLSQVNRLDVIHSQLKSRINSPLTSSAGRLFDAVASLIGIRQIINYEAQAAIELEALVEPAEHARYPFYLDNIDGSHSENQDCHIINPEPMIVEIVDDLRSRVSVNIIAAKFHNTLAAMVKELCLKFQENCPAKAVVLSGGVWQNQTLFKKTVRAIQQDDFRVYYHQQVPCNDGGISLGQAMIASTRASSDL